MSKISLQDAADMNARYREQRETLLAEGFDTDILPLCETFKKEEIEQILNQEGCIALRIYFGMDAGLNIHGVLVGVNDANEDMIQGDEPEILDDAVRCPNNCPPASDLNS